jgi:hypothetical protein
MYESKTARRGAWSVERAVFLLHTAIQDPDRVAALVPISGGSALPYAKNLVDVPT